MEPDSPALDSSDARNNLLPEAGHDTVWNKAAITGAMLHLHEATIDSPTSVAEFEIYLNLDPDVTPNERHRGFCGSFKKRATDVPSFVSFDVLRGIGALPPGQPPRVSVILKSDGYVTFSGASLMVFSRTDGSQESKP